MLVHRNTVNISIKALKEILKVAEEGGLGDRNVVAIDLRNNTMGLKEHYYAPTILRREFIIIDGEFYERLDPHNCILELKPR